MHLIITSFCEWKCIAFLTIMFPVFFNCNLFTTFSTCILCWQSICSFNNPIYFSNCMILLFDNIHHPVYKKVSMYVCISKLHFLYFSSSLSMHISNSIFSWNSPCFTNFLEFFMLLASRYYFLTFFLFLKALFLTLYWRT